MPETPKFHRYYDGAVPSELCQKIVENFDKDTDGHMKGMLLDRSVRYSMKKCTDISMGLRITESEEGKGFWEEIDGELFKCVAESWSQFQTDTPSLRFLSNSAQFQDTGYQLQRYEPNEGMFAPHIDSGSIDSAFRIAAAVIYFNTVEEGGGTRFPEWGETIDAVEGRILWFPSGWTHVHEGLVPVSGPKYVASTFMCYKGYTLLDSRTGPCYQHIMNSIRTADLRKPAPDAAAP